MHATFLFLLGSLPFLASASALKGVDERALAQGAVLPGDGTAELFARDDCKENGCSCQKGTEQGRYCGLCKSGASFYVSNRGSGGTSNDVFECNPRGGCCNYGRASDCVAGKNMRCGDARQDYIDPCLRSHRCD